MFTDSASWPEPRTVKNLYMLCNPLKLWHSATTAGRDWDTTYPSETLLSHHFFLHYIVWHCHLFLSKVWELFCQGTVIPATLPCWAGIYSGSLCGIKMAMTLSFRDMAFCSSVMDSLAIIMQPCLWSHHPSALHALSSLFFYLNIFTFIKL